MPHRLATASLFAKGGVSSTGKPALSIHKPADSAGAEDESFFENENEDENKTGFDTVLPFENHFHSIYSQLVLNSAAVSRPKAGSSPETEQALYLSICAFRI